MFGKKNSQDGALAARMASIASKPAPTSVEPVAPRRPKRPEREPTYKPGFLTMSRGEKLQVIVKNIDEGGARIEFYQHTALPDEVLLTAGPKTKARARVVWQNDNAAGLKFI
jgi:hypothetical protein